ncbi:MAG: HRDC domain-containing protein [Planctomycetota bacterium]|nr:HRDC domain-containing protein [Planctomycetota bacterium]
MARDDKYTLDSKEGRGRKRQRGGGGSPLSKRSVHRMRSHETSQAEAELEAPAEIPEHPLIPAGEPEIIDTNEALDSMLDHVRSMGRFAYDTEFIGELSYYPKICLIQLATRERIALVDPLSNVNLDEVWSLVADPDVETLVHAGAQDLEPIARHIGRVPENIFDTQVAAGFCGFSYPLGLGRLIEEILDIKLGKGLTFTHWDHRPLSAVHIRYAADDVRFLPSLAEVLRDRLAQLEHSEWSSGECRSIAEAAMRNHDAESLSRKVKGMHQLRPRKLAVLRSLVLIREGAARQHDVPARSLMKDSVLIDLARNPVSSVQKLDKVPGLSRRVAQAYGAAIVEGTKSALAIPDDELPSRPAFVKETPVDQVRIDALNALSGSLSYARQIAPSLAVNRKDVAQLYLAYRYGRDLESCRLMLSWRKDMIGQPLVDLLEGRSEVTIGWADERLYANLNTRETEKE